MDRAVPYSWGNFWDIIKIPEDQSLSVVKDALKPTVSTDEMASSIGKISAAIGKTDKLI